MTCYFTVVNSQKDETFFYSLPQYGDDVVEATDENQSYTVVVAIVSSGRRRTIVEKEIKTHEWKNIKIPPFFREKKTSACPARWTRVKTNGDKES